MSGCCLRSEKFKKLDEAGEYIEEILEMKNLHAALVKSQINKSGLNVNYLDEESLSIEVYKIKKAIDEMNKNFSQM